MPVLARALLLLAFVVLVVGGTVLGIASRRVGRTYDVPMPAIVGTTTATEIARGARLFRTDCLDCHAGPIGADGGGVERRPVGARVAGAPAFLGEIWAPNVTADPVSGIGAWTDGELARLFRNGLRRDGRYAATMPRFARLGDEDVAALIGFLRSADPLVAATPNRIPESKLGLAGTLALAFAAGVDTRGAPHIATPTRGPTADYGRYLASAVYGCVDCHTDGFKTTEQNLASPALLAGGLFLRTPRGDSIYSTNLTADTETGLSAWTVADLTRVLSTGVGRDGMPARAPMPVFRYLDADEAAAIFAYLRSVPAVNRKTPGPPRERPAADMPPARLFAALDCGECHGDGAPHRALLKKAARMSTAEIAAVIRNPESRYVGTQMPTYAAAIDEATALRLATWLQATGGNPHP